MWILQVQPFDEAAADAATAAVWRQVWPAQRLRQREFFSFGMEVLLKLDLQVSGSAEQLRGKM